MNDELITIYVNQGELRNIQVRVTKEVANKAAELMNKNSEMEGLEAINLAKEIINNKK